VTLEGHAAEKIIEYARAQGADVILASSHGRSGIKPWPLGSTVNRLLHERLPIIVIQAEKEASRNPDLFSRVLVPLDGSDASTSVITPLIQVSEKTATEITLVRIIEKEHHVHTLGGLNYIPYLDSDMDTKKAAAAEYLKGIASRFTGTRAVVKTEVHVGDPADEILKLASHKDASLIALASHVHSALESWFYGSVTQKIIQAAKRSFLLVPTEGTG